MQQVCPQPIDVPVPPLSSMLDTVDLLIIFVSFPDWDFVNYVVPPFIIPPEALQAVPILSDYYRKMSFNKQVLRIKVARRLAPAQDSTYIADNNHTYYFSNFGALNHLDQWGRLEGEVFNKAYQDDSTIFDSVDAVGVVTFGNDIIGPAATGYGTLGHFNSPYGIPLFPDSIYSQRHGFLAEWVLNQNMIQNTQLHTILNAWHWVGA